MAGKIHELAPHHLPPFITAPGETDVLFVVIVVAMIAIVLIVGNFYFKLHALPEKMAHSANSAQLQLVGVLALLALFTHNNIFWIAALLIAALRVPDFSTPLNTIAQSVRGLTDRFDRAVVLQAAPAQPASAHSAAAELEPEGADDPPADQGPAEDEPDDPPAPSPDPAQSPAPDEPHR